MLLVLASAGLGAVAQTCALPGWEGPAAPAGVINSYHGGSGSPGAGATSITVSSLAGLRSNTRSLRVGDLVLIMQMQDSATPGNAGLHEYAQIVAIAGATLALNRPLSSSYAQTMGTTNVRNWQVVWVPQYSAATISGTVSADRWSINTGSGVATGGVVALDVAGSLALNGTVTAAGSGFRGAAGLNGTSSRAGGTYTDADYNFTTTVAAMNGALKGEGIEGTPINVFDGTATPPNYFALLGQGYAAGAAGRAARSNAGGAGNDGDPAAVAGYGGNQLNAGGGGGGNWGAGGNGGNNWNQNLSGGVLNQSGPGNSGNAAGGLGGNAATNLSTRLVMGGGGGAGTANNGSANSVTDWPPQANTSAAGAITSSGASGGGVVLIRAGSISGAGVMDASGYRAYNKNPVGDTDAAGGGGAGGSVFATTGTGGGAGITLRATGGGGGFSNYFNHGPGGGGGGGFIGTSLGGATLDVTGGANGTDGCCGGGAGNGSPKAWNATPGAGGVTNTSIGAGTGVQGGASCLPVITATKSTLTPTLTSANGATASYQISLRNTGGAASNVFLLDPLPPGWGYTGATAATYTYLPAPPAAANSPASGAETVSAGAPGALPASSVPSANSLTAVALRAAGSAPGVTPTTGANTPTFGSFYLPQNGAITVSFAVTIPAAATAGTYHNPAGVIFLDPTRTTSAARMVTPAAEAGSNRTGVNYSANTSYASGSATTVLGSNYSGAAAGPTTEDVRLLPDFSVVKTASGSGTPGRTISYTITAVNAGWAVGPQSYAATQATDVTLANVPTTLGSNPLTVTDTLPAGVTPTGAFTSSGFSCSGSGVQVCTLANALAYPIAASTTFATITGVVTLTAACGASPRTNTVVISAATGEVNSSNNTASVTTSVTCGTSLLTVSKTNGTGTVVSGSTTAYTVTVANAGPSDGSGTTLTDVASPGLSCSTVTCAASGGAVCPAPSMPFGSLTTGIQIPVFPAGSTASFVVSCSISATGF
ncbi:MAG: hypothetical protein ABI919_04270 [Ramlibacter sp.]